MPNHFVVISINDDEEWYDKEIEKWYDSISEYMSPSEVSKEMAYNSPYVHLSNVREVLKERCTKEPFQKKRCGLTKTTMIICAKRQD